MTANPTPVQELLDRVKNNIALDVKSCSGTVWLLVPDTCPEKNIFANSPLLIFEVVGYAVRS